MDFFEAQDRARRRSKRLVFLFALAVLGTIAVSYLAALLILGYLDGRGGSPSLWDPKLFFAVAGGTVAVVGCASLFKWSMT